MAKVVEDRRYHFRIDFPGASAKVDQSEGKAGRLAWRAYTANAPATRAGGGHTAAVKVWDTDATDVRELFAAGENDASQALGITLIGRRDGTFGPDKLPSLTLSFQSGRDGAADMVRATVLLVVKGTRLYEVTYSFTGIADQSAAANRLFQSFAILK